MPDNNKSIQKIKEVKAEIIPADRKDDQSAVILEPQKLEVKKGGNIIIGSLNVFTTPVKKRWHKHYNPKKNKNWHINLIVDAVLAVIILALIAFNIYLLKGEDFIVNNQVALNIQINQEQIISGSRITYLIDYKNNSKYKLTDVNLAVQLPAEFILEQAVPQNMFSDHTNTFNLDTIASGGNGQVQISGIIFGEINSQQKIIANLDYLPTKNSRRKQKVASYEYTITNSNFKLEIEMLNKVANGQEIDLIIKYRNQSDFDVEQFIIESNLPNNNFKITKSSIPESEPGIWKLDNIPTRAQGQISIAGNFITPKEQNKIENIFDLFIKSKNQKLLQTEIKANIEIIHAKLNLEIESVDSNITLGEWVEYTLIYDNQENFDLENIKFDIKDNQNLIEQVEFTENISVIAKNDKGEIKFKLKTKPEIKQETSMAKNFNLELLAQASYNNPQENNLEVFAFSDKLIQKINTALNFYTSARYYTAEGDQLGIGPLPPKAGSQTKYWIIFNIENLYNNVSNIVVTANLAENISWTGNISTTEDNPVKYNESNKQIIWQVSEVQAPSTFLPSIGSAFEISFIPELDQIGQIANLIENIQISATDNFTNEKIIKNLPIITTNLINDEKENSGGIIQSQ